jgi:hypothetical protein
MDCVLIVCSIEINALRANYDASLMNAECSQEKILSIGNGSSPYIGNGASPYIGNGDSP